MYTTGSWLYLFKNHHEIILTACHRRKTQCVKRKLTKRIVIFYFNIISLRFPLLFRPFWSFKPQVPSGKGGDRWQCRAPGVGDEGTEYQHPLSSLEVPAVPDAIPWPQEGSLVKIIFWLTRNSGNILCLSVSKAPSEGATICTFGF